MYALPNNRADLTFEIAKPWEDWKKFPIPAEITDKKKMEAWRTNATTRHAFISGVGGLNPRSRASAPRKGGEEGNEPATMAALVCDYDVAVSDEKAMQLLSEPPVPLMPNFIVDSFSEEGDSGRKKRRLVWLFECPVRLSGMRHATRFFKVLHEKLRLPKWLAGFDEGGHKPTMYFEIGRTWTPLAGQPIPKSILFGWLAESVVGLNLFEDRERPGIDIELIARAVADKFPGRWQGEFARGSQGVRFWDAAADNERGCVVGDHGMICFTGPKGFVSWEEIFGESFVDGVRGDQWGKLLENFYWDGAHMWRYNGACKRWVQDSMEGSRRTWRLAGVSGSRKGGRPSDIDRLEETICTVNYVEGALPFVHRPQGEIRFEGQRYLNTTNVRVLEPAPNIDPETPMEFDLYGARHFPWAKGFLRGFFEPPVVRPGGIPEGVPIGDIPLFIYLAWLQRCYATGYRQNPQARQAIVLAGPQGSGKTFLVQGIMGALLGPVAEGSGFMVEGTNFTSLIAERPILFIDDATPASTADGHKRFSAMIKKMVACSNLLYNKKYGGQGQVEWFGSTVLACNLDPESQRSLPSIDQSTLDKISLFQIKNGVYLPGKIEQQKYLDSEMRMFARFLLDWEPPEWTKAPLSYRGRFGVRAYHHAALREAASATGTPNTVLEVLRDMYEDWKDNISEVSSTLSGAALASAKGEPRAWAWSGRATRLHRDLSRYSPGIIGRLSSNQLSLALGVLASKGFKIERNMNGTWRIVFDDKMLHAFDPTHNTEYQ